MKTDRALQRDLRLNNRFNQKWRWTIILAFVLAILLSGCGGGSGGEDDAGGGSDASLSGLNLEGIALDQTFQADQLNYSASVVFSQDTITLSPIAADTGATIRVNNVELAPGSASAAVDLEVGQNLIDIVVTSGNRGTTLTYTLSVSRASASSDANLSDLGLAGAALDQLFQPSQTAYSASVGFLQTLVTLTPIAADAGATIHVNGTEVTSGNASAAIALSEGQNTISLAVTAEDGSTTQRYSIDIMREDAGFFAQQTYLKASNAEGGYSQWHDYYGDRFGSSVAISGDSLVVGAPGKSIRLTGIEWKDSKIDYGAVYVFTRSGGVWKQQAILKASYISGSTLYGVTGNEFGYSVAISGDTLIVGSPNADSSDDHGLYNELVPAPSAGAVFVFTRSDGTWNLQTSLKASNAEEDDHFGTSLAISGDTLVVGAPGEDGNAIGGEDDNSASNVGAAYVFNRSGGVWEQQAYLKGSTASDGPINVFGFGFGTSVAISGDTLAVSYPTGNWLKCEAYIFIRSGGTWNQQAYLKSGDDSDYYFNEHLGRSLALSGDTLVVGEPKSDQACIFTRNGETWSLQTILKGSNTEDSDYFGSILAISEDTLVVGAPGEDSSANGGEADNSASNAGAAYTWQ
jgi:hypothetical protein